MHFWSTRCPIQRWLSRFALDACIAEHAAVVVRALPAEVREDLMGDPHFTLCDYDPRSSGGMQVPVSFSRGSRRARSVVLKRTLTQRSTAFVRWLIAHELAHAHLHNGGRWDGEDPEHAADALAADWGFARPADARR